MSEGKLKVQHSTTFNKQVIKRQYVVVINNNTSHHNNNQHIELIIINNRIAQLTCYLAKTMIAVTMNTLLLTVFTIALKGSEGFTQPFNKPSLTILQRQDVSTSLYAKKKKGKKSGKGFGKQSATPPTAKSTPAESAFTTSSGTDDVPAGFSSIEATTPQSFARPQVDIDPNLSQEEKNKEILKQQFGLRSFEEKQGDIKAAEKMAEQRSRMQKIKQMEDEEFDIFMVLPPGLVKAIDLFLKTGLAVTTGLFILAGVGITAEAWSVATSNNLPENVDSFIVNVIEPNFTPGLFVLLAFSVSLGIFATAQLGSGSSTYKEQ